jgi:hypothetical protein
MIENSTDRQNTTTCFAFFGLLIVQGMPLIVPLLSLPLASSSFVSSHPLLRIPKEEEEEEEYAELAVVSW